jgi:pectin methylesterase-like acyl-CoA thioesterase
VSIEFNRTPIIKAGGKIQIVDASGAVFDSVTSNPNGDLYFSGLVNRSSAGKSFKSDVLDIVYNSVVFHPKGNLAFGKTYYVTVDEGMISDELGTKFSVKQSDNWTFTVRAQAPAASSAYMLAADGGGDYCSLEGVLQALPNSAASPRLVQVGPGVYPGIVRMGHSQVRFVGAGLDKSIFSHKNSATMNSASREGIVVSGSDVSFENLTIFNTYLKDSNGQQAEALYVAEGSSKVFLKNVHLRSHQDTLRVDGSAYMEGGKISGSTDPLWGYGAFYCDGCELSSRTSGHAFVVTRSTKGFGLVNCSVTKESESIKSTYLAQYHDGSEPGKIAFVKCKMDAHVAGWRRAENNAWYEYQNTKLQSGEPLSFDGRQLTAGSAELDALSSAKSWLGWSP